MKPLDLTNFYKIYFNFAYFLCLTPHRFTTDPGFGAGAKLQKRLGENDNVIIRVNPNKTGNSPLLFSLPAASLPRKLLCGFSTLIAIWCMVADLYYGLPKETNARSPKTYFSCVAALSVFTLKALTINHFWRNHTNFLEILNFLGRNSRFNSSRNLCFNQTWIIGLFPVLCLVVTFSNFLVMSCSPELGLKGWFQYFAWFMDPELAGNALGLLETHFQLAICIPVFVGFVHSELLNLFGKLLLLMSILTLWSATKGFSSRFNGKELLHQQQHQCPVGVGGVNNGMKIWGRRQLWREISEHLNFLRDLSFLIRKVSSSTVLAVLLQAIVNFAVMSEYFTTTSSNFKPEEMDYEGVLVVLADYVVVRVTIMFAILILAADICSQVKTLIDFAIKFKILNEIKVAFFIF